MKSNEYVKRLKKGLFCLISLAMMLALAVMLLPGPVRASPSTLYVDDDWQIGDASYAEDTDGDTDFATIQAAIDAASPGDTILVAAGMYTENIDVDKSVTIQSQSGTDKTTIDSSTEHVFNVTADNVNISGFTVKGAIAAGKGGIYLDQVNSCTVSGNICSDNYCGIYLDQSNDNTISGNTTNQNGECGIYVDNSDNNILNENTVSGNDNYGFLLDGSNSNTLTSNFVTYNNIGIKIDGSVDASTITINFSNIVGNTNYGVQNDGTGTLDATNNWWGDASGPYDPDGDNEVPPCTDDPTTEKNADGTGDKVSDNVDYCPWTGAAIEESQTETITGSGIITDTHTGGDVTIDATTGDHTLSTAKYEDNPGGSLTFESSGNYYDVHLDTAMDVNSLTVEFCPATESMGIYYWDENDWRYASEQVYSDECIMVTITGSTDPSLSDLTGLPFASGTPLVADADGPHTGTAGESVTLSGSASGGVTPYSYAWDLDNDGAYDDSTDQNPSYTWDAAGDYLVGLQVTDSATNTDTDTASVDISEAGPPPVGGTVYPSNNLALLAPWIGLGAIIVGAIIFLRRRVWS